jgi:hypothetical protein
MSDRGKMSTLSLLVGGPGVIYADRILNGNIVIVMCLTGTQCMTRYMHRDLVQVGRWP